MVQSRDQSAGTSVADNGEIQELSKTEFYKWNSKKLNFTGVSRMTYWRNIPEFRKSARCFLRSQSVHESFPTIIYQGPSMCEAL